jgi:hypothetical protein
MRQALRLATITVLLTAFLAACGQPTRTTQLATLQQEDSVGNRAMLSIGTCCEFEANNCLPVTWLSLFGSDDFVVETHQEGGEEFKMALYRTPRSAALQRVNSAISRLEGETPAWAYLRPLKILWDELQYCSSSETVELDVTQFWAKDEAYRQRVIDAASAFSDMLNTITGDETQDLVILDRFVDEYSIASVTTVADLHPENRMFILIGTYWGEREHLYTLEYFGETYWTANP